MLLDFWIPELWVVHFWRICCVARGGIALVHEQMEGGLHGDAVGQPGRLN